MDKIENLQPYPDRKENEWLADLQRLSNPDKHKTLTATPTLGIGHVQLWKKNPHYPGDEHSIRVAKDASGQEIYVQYPLHLGVLIDKGMVENVLRTLSERVRETLESFLGEF